VQIRTTATGLYQRIRASTERARNRIGLDQSHGMRRSWPCIPARRTARGNTECDRPCGSPRAASLSGARSWSVAMRRGGDGLGPDVYLRCTCRVPRIDLRPASRPVGPPSASGSSRSEAASAVLAPRRLCQGCSRPFRHHPDHGSRSSSGPARRSPGTRAPASSWSTAPPAMSRWASPVIRSPPGTSLWWAGGSTRQRWSRMPGCPDARMPALGGALAGLAAVALDWW
jgi:hypothetical protein